MLGPIGTIAYSFVGRAWRDRIIGVRTSSRVVALTFDDGPDPMYTPIVLDVLDAYTVPATFFLLGSHVEANPSLAKELTHRGHVVANHGYSHRPFPSLSRKELVQEILACEQAISNATGAHTPFVRPPYGRQTAAKHALLNALGYQSIFWSSAGEDWSGDPSPEIAARVVANSEPGGIILLHDGWTAHPDESHSSDQQAVLRDRTPMIEALPLIFEHLRNDGYRFVTIPELMTCGRPRRGGRFVAS